MTQSKTERPTWRFTFKNVDRKPTLVSAISPFGDNPIQNGVIPSAIQVATGCNERGVVKGFRSVHDIFEARRNKLPMRSKADSICAGRRQLVVTMLADEVRT